MSLDEILKVKKNAATHFDISVVIPSWNNLNYLKNCIQSIKSHSAYKIQVIVVINEGKDGTYEWIKNLDDVDYVYSPQNLGVCLALNSARSLVASNYFCYANDDMYFLPEWDKPLMNEIIKIGTKNFMLSSTLIEPIDTGNKCVIVGNYGQTLENFEKENLLKDYKTLIKKDWQGSSWPPNIVHIDTWDAVGAYSIEYSPGFYSDPDFSKKLYDIGIRHFRGISESRVYHFGTKSTGRVKRNNGRSTFLLKHGMTSNTFYKHCLKMGEEWEKNNSTKPLPLATKWANKLKAIGMIFER